MPRALSNVLCKMASVASIIAAAVLLLYVISSPTAAKKGPKVTDIVRLYVQLQTLISLINVLLLCVGVL